MQFCMCVKPFAVFFCRLKKARRQEARRGQSAKKFALAALFFTFLAVARAAPTEIDIPVLAASFGSEFFQETARDFEKLRPDVRVHISGDARIDEKVRIRIMAGDFPDATDAVLLYDTLIATGKIRDLHAALDGKNWEGDQRWADTFLPGVFERWTRGPHVYALPFAYGVWSIFYDRDLFAREGWRPPRTWDELYALCDAIKAKGLAPFAFPGVYLRYGDAFLRAAHYNLVGKEGFQAYNELAPGARSDPRFTRAAEVVQRLSTRYFMEGWQGMTHTAADQAFLQRKAAMVTSAWFPSETRGVVPKDFHVGAFNLPIFADGITDPNTIQAQAGYYFLFATGDPAREQATLDFFRFLTSRERARAFAREVEAPVALRSVEPDDYHSESMQAVAAIMRRAPATFDSAPPASAAFRALFNQEMTDARFRLMNNQLAPPEFGRVLERAAQTQRERAEDRNRVDWKHPVAAFILLGCLLLSGGTLAGQTWKRRKRNGGFLAGENSLNAAPLKGETSGFYFWFVGPALALFAFFVLWPSATAFGWSFFHWDGFTPRVWAGWFNFKWLFLESDGFWFSLRNNLFVMVVPTLAVVPTALFLAALLHRGVLGSKFFRSVFLFPNLLGGVAATLLWMNAYDPQGGLINTALTQLGRFLGNDALKSFHGYAWLAQNHLYWSLVPIYLWMACGFNLVLYLAAMQGIDPQLYEAADLEGASPLRQFFTITIPLIRNILVTSAVFIVIAGLNAFELIWLLTSQDPASDSHVLSTLMVSTMFREFQIGRATAIAVVMFILVAMISLFVLRTFDREETFE